MHGAVTAAVSGAGAKAEAQLHRVIAHPSATVGGSPTEIPIKPPPRRSDMRDVRRFFQENIRHSIPIHAAAITLQ